MTAEPEMNAARFLEKSAIRFPDLTAVSYGTTSYDYREFYRRACSLGGELRARGLRHGDRVAFALHNSPSVLETIFGCFAAGLTVVPMNARLHAKEMGYIVRTSGARVLIHGAAFSAEITRQIDDFGSLDGRFEVDATL